MSEQINTPFHPLSYDRKPKVGKSGKQVHFSEGIIPTIQHEGDRLSLEIVVPSMSEQGNYMYQ